MTFTISSPSKFGKKSTALPSSKSLSNRALIINALSGSPQEIKNLAQCDDTAVMLAALQGEKTGETLVDVHGAGTSMRFLTAYFSLQPMRRTITGSARMQQRPISILVDALRSLGADIDYAQNEGFPPLTVGGGSMTGSQISLPANVSSQYISALLMIGPCLKSGLTLTLNGDIASRPYIDMTLALMRLFGAQATWTSPCQICVSAGGYSPVPFTVESDRSAASYWYEILSLCHDQTAETVLLGVEENSLQGDAKGAEYFEKLGVETIYNAPDATLRKIKSENNEICIDLSGEPDLAQTLVATCCGLGVKFRFEGLANLRVKETDRTAAMENELRKLGFVVKDLSDGTVYWDGERCTPDEHPVIRTYDDHRMAMSLAPLCITHGPLSIENPEVVSKSYPTFWDDLRRAGFTITQEA